MRESVLHWLKLYEDEVVIFLWTTALLFFVRSSGMILNNYAETAFLKRYGIEYMPIVNMINTVVTFFITGVMAAFMSRMSGSKILFYPQLMTVFNNLLYFRAINVNSGEELWRSNGTESGTILVKPWHC